MPNVRSTTIEIREGIKARDITPFVLSLVFKESLLSGNTVWEMKLFAESISSEEQLMFAADAISLRITTTQGDKSQTTGWRLLYVVSSNLLYSGSSSVIQLIGSDFSAVMNTTPKWRAFENVSALSVFSTIAADNGLRFESDAIKTLSTWLQLGESDWDFLRRVINEVVMTAGQRRAWLFVDNKILRLISIGYSKQPVRSFSIGAGDDRVENIKFSYNGETHTYTASGFDVQNKLPITYSPKEETLPILAGKKISAVTSKAIYARTALTSKATVADESTALWADIASKHFSFQATLAGDLRIKLADLVDIVAVDPTGESSALNGKYPVYEIVHMLQTEQGGGDEKYLDLSTHIGGFRRTCHAGSIIASGSNFSNIKSKDKYNTFSAQQEDNTVLKAEILEIE